MTSRNFCDNIATCGCARSSVDRVPGYEPVGREFESPRARQKDLFFAGPFSVSVFKEYDMQKSFKQTIYASYICYISQGIVNNLAPLLFLTFISLKWVSLSTVTLLTTVNFFTQLSVDLLSAYFVDRIGYRICVVAANIFTATGLIGMAVLPSVLPSPFAGLIISVILYAIGGGLLEVLVSPIVEACPSENKEKAMSLLHSFYCWGVVIVVAFSTLFFTVFGRENWRWLCFAWAILPLLNAFLFTRVPINTLTEKGEGMTLKQLFTKKVFLVFALLMFAAGASELAMAQWASAFAESSLGVSKTIGDIAGPCAFSVLMGMARAIYGKFGDKLKLHICILSCSVLCALSYLAAALSPLPVFSLIGCAVCGFSVGIMWPGTFSLAAKSMPKGGTALFAMLALAGDLGCTCGPTAVGIVSSLNGDSLRTGLLAATLFPIIMIIGVILQQKLSVTES